MNSVLNVVQLLLSSHFNQLETNLSTVQTVSALVVHNAIVVVALADLTAVQDRCLTLTLNVLNVVLKLLSFHSSQHQASQFIALTAIKLAVVTDNLSIQSHPLKKGWFDFTEIHRLDIFSQFWYYHYTSMYTSVQEQFLAHIKEKTKQWFEQFPVAAHNFDHAERVADYAMRIASQEKGNVFLCEVAAILHDIGRVPEKYDGRKERHHELSYELLKKWFAEDSAFDILNQEEKIEVLYALRYHWCDAADDFETAIILRDADKLDLLGEKGMERAREWAEEKNETLNHHVYGKFYCFYWLRKETSKRIADQEQLMKPIDEYYINFLRQEINDSDL